MDFITLTAEDRVTETTKVTTGYFTGDLGTLAGSNFTTSSLTAGEKKYYYNLQYSSEDQLSVSYGHIHGSGSESGSTANKVGQTEAVYRQFASQLLKPEDVNGGFIINNLPSLSIAQSASRKRGTISVSSKRHFCNVIIKAPIAWWLSFSFTFSNMLPSSLF